ncbi:MAG: leucine-rich repeat domain-containing protein [Ruminococcus sp.]|nr:leucine-rich repeat domain-containing protein [Ruminococcus sp.]
MHINKKAAAFLMSLLICASAAPNVWADTEENEISDGTASDSIFVDEDGNLLYESEEDTELVKTGDFSYTVSDDGTAAIQSCTSTDINLVVPSEIDGKKVTYIGARAFGEDPENNIYETITIPSTVEYISASNPFLFCGNLKEIIVEDGNQYFTAVDGVLYSKDKSELICYPSAKSGDTFTIDSNTASVGIAAVYNTSLKTVKFPSKLEKISRHAFAVNNNLTSVDLSSTALEDIGDFAFSECSKLSDVKFPESINKIGGGAFSECRSITSIEFPVGLLAIGQSAFANTGLTYAKIPVSVQEIGYSAFGYEIDEEGNETPVADFIIVGNENSAAYTYSIDSDDDYGYKNEFMFLTPEDFETREEVLNLEKFVEGDFEYAVVNGEAAITNCSSSDANLTVPDTLGGYPVTSTYLASFTNCSAQSIVLPEGMKLIRQGSFFGCQYLSRIKLPQSMETVEKEAFGKCETLQEIDFGGAVTIGEDIAVGSDSLSTVIISGNCKEILGADPFLYNTSLIQFVVGEGGDGNFSAVDGVLYNRDQTALLVYPKAKEDKLFKIPSSVKSVAQSAFAYSQYLETIDLNTVEEIETYAFEGCSVLSRVIMSKELRVLGSDAFYNCKDLKSIRFYDKLEKLGTYSFGFLYDGSADTENGEEADVVNPGFKLYAKKNSTPYNYAQDFGIEVVTGTIEIFGRNVSVPFLIVCGALVLVLIIALIAMSSAKKIKKKKEERKQQEIKEKVAKKIAEKKNSAETKENTEKSEEKE